MQVMTRLNCLGMQNAARKYCDGGMIPGAWTGALVSTFEDVAKGLSKIRWAKTKFIIRKLLRIIREVGFFKFKSLLSDRGFMTYVAQTHPAMVPYLKGFHLTIDSWREGRDDDGWRVRIDYKVQKALAKRREGTEEECLDEALEEASDAVVEELKLLKITGKDNSSDNQTEKSTQGGAEGPPDIAYPATRFLDDLLALEKMTESEEPIKQYVRAKRCDMVKFGFGDASGGGYGSTLAKLLGDANIRHGRWALFYSAEETSSNFRELRNLVDAVALDYERGLLDGFELFLFTDNSVAERAYHKGTSSSKTLFDLVLKLRLIEMEGRMIIHVIHISGKRMIHCGIDGLSRGDTTDGIAAGVTMDNYVPLHLSCMERAPAVEKWIQSWWPMEEFGKLELLSEEDWFIWDENKSNCLWTPAPAGGEAAVEEMANWIHHTSERIHLFVIPTIWTVTWRKTLGKSCDLTVAIPNVFDFWNRRNPGGCDSTQQWVSWKGNCVKCKKTLTDPLSEIFCGNFCSKRGNFGACYSVWCASCYRASDTIDFPRVIPLDDEGEAMPCKEDDLFMMARPGDTLMTSYQCELCHFRNIKGRNPYDHNKRDMFAMNVMRRANLDAFWSRTLSTVYSNYLDFKQFVKHSESLWGDVPGIPPRGPFPTNDAFGMTPATSTLSRSLDKGKNAKHVQYNTARRIQSAYSNMWNASLNTLDTGVMQDGQSKLMTTKCPVYHYWYSKMMKGMHERMGDLVVQDQAVSQELQEAIMARVERKLSVEPNNHRWIEVGTYLMMLWLGALRGNEAMMADLGGCIKMMKESESKQTQDKNYGVLVLKGRFKSSIGATHYLLYLSSNTKSNFVRPFRGWMVRLIELRKRQGRTSGWLFARADKKPLEMSHYEVDILRLIVEIQQDTEGIISKDLDVFDRYGVFRLWRRGATSVARNTKGMEKDIELNNWWRKMENSRGKHVNSDMLSYYTEDLLVMDAKLWFLEAL